MERSALLPRMPIHNSSLRVPHAAFGQPLAHAFQPDINNNRYQATRWPNPDQIRPFYSAHQQLEERQQRAVTLPRVAKSIGSSLLSRLALNYWSPDHSASPLAPNLENTLSVQRTSSVVLFTSLYDLMNEFSGDENLVTLISNFEFFSSNYSAEVGLEILSLCRKNTIAQVKFDFKIFNTFFGLMCSGAFTDDNLHDMIQLAEAYGIESNHFESEVRSFYQARNHMGWISETDSKVRDGLEKILTVTNLNFASKAALIEAFENRFETTQDEHDVWRMVQLTSEGIKNRQIDSGNSFYFAKRLRQTEYDLAAMQSDLNFFGLFAEENERVVAHLTQNFYTFTNSKFQMTSRHLRGQGKFSLPVAQLPERSRQAWFALECAFGDPETLQLGRLLFGNQSFNHRLLDETEKRDLITELFNAVADYIQLKQFSSLDDLRADPLIERWFDPEDESVETYHDKTFRTNSLVREKRNSSGVALLALGFLKELRGQVWASAHLNQFIPFPEEQTDPTLRHVFTGRNKINPDGLYYLYDEELDDSEPVILEVKSFNEGDESMSFSELKQFGPIQRGNAHGTLRYQFGRMAYHLTKNPELHLHYHLITDVQSVTKEGEPISDEVRAAAFKRLLQRYLEKELNLSKDKAYDVMDRVIVTFDKYLKTE